ncbi:hypothetical protein HDU86_008377 [Geranomyces michiganensis]|nr:hypothetical protein HDU86_008377 [Geranomyces michiganensis]
MHACDEFRPCTRCTKFNLGDSCRDSERKERTKGFKRGSYKRTSSTTSSGGGGGVGGGGGGGGGGCGSDGYDHHHPLGTEDFLGGDRSSDSFPYPLHREKPSKSMPASALVKSSVPDSVSGTAPQLAMAAEFEHRSSAGAMHQQQQQQPRQNMKQQEGGQPRTAFPAYHHLYIATSSRPEGLDQCRSHSSPNHHHHLHPHHPTVSATGHATNRRHRRAYLDSQEHDSRDSEQTPPMEAVQVAANELSASSPSPTSSADSSPKTPDNDDSCAETQTDWTKLDVLSTLCSAVLHDGCENISKDGGDQIVLTTAVTSAALANPAVPVDALRPEKWETELAATAIDIDELASANIAGVCASASNNNNSNTVAGVSPEALTTNGTHDLVPLEIPMLAGPRGHRTSGPSSFCSLFGTHPPLHSDHCSHHHTGTPPHCAANHNATSTIGAGVPLLPTVYPDLTHLHMHHPGPPHLPMSFIDYRHHHHRGPAAAPPPFYSHHVSHLAPSAFRRHWDYACEEGFEEATALMNRYTEVGDMDVDDPPDCPTAAVSGRCSWIEF